MSKLARVPSLPTAFLPAQSSLSPNHKISYEFKNYLTHLERHGKRHLYINLMSALSGDDETDKCRSLNGAQSKTLTVVTLDKDSDFYWQTGSFERRSDAKELIDELYTRLISRSKTNFWPGKLNTQEWRNTTIDIIRRVYELDFGSKKVLSQEERQDLIELVYVELIDELIVKLNPHFANISCKNTIDRGPSLFVLLYLKNRLRCTGHELHEIVSLAVAQPILMRNRTAHKPRFERMVRTAKRLLARVP